MRPRLANFVTAAALTLLAEPHQAHAQIPAQFDPPIVLPAGAGPGGINTADVNRDSFLDFIVSNIGDGNGGDALSVFPSDGAGWFGPRRDYRSDGPGGGTPVIADLTGDGRPDVLVANGTETASIFRGLPKGGFRGRADVAIGQEPQAIAAADFNRDGNSDFAVASYRGNSISVLLGRGHGRFAAPSVYPGHNGPGALAVVDLNVDGTSDLVAGNLNNDYAGLTSTISVRMGNGDGTFGNATEVAVGRYSGVVLTGDFNEDGKPDLASVNAESRTVSVLVGDGAGGFSSIVEYPTGDLPLGGTVGDMNRDNHLDIVVTNHQDNTVTILHGRGDGTFAPGVDYSAGGAHHNDPEGVAAADVNRDGWTDLAIVNYSSNTIAVLLNRGEAAGRANALHSAAAMETRTPGARSGNLLLERLESRTGANVHYSVPPGGGIVSIKIFSVTGRMVADLVSGFEAGGVHVARWDGRGDGSTRLPSSVYFVRAAIGESVFAHRIVLVE